MNPALIRSTSASSGMVQVPRPTRATDSLVALGADNVDDGSETINVPPSDTQLRSCVRSSEERPSCSSSAIRV